MRRPVFGLAYIRHVNGYRFDGGRRLGVQDYMVKHVNIMGTRGVPARHGGYETFAAHLAPYLVGRGWGVTVYCQDDEGIDGLVDDWDGVERVHFVPKATGARGTMEFDAKTVRHVRKQPGVDLVLGYNTACFNIAQRLIGRKVAMNMDGIEWRREKWSLIGKAWFFLNEIIGANIANIPIADHPEIARHLKARSLRSIVTIPYGADAVYDAPKHPLSQFGLEPDRYMISIGRPVPENSILEIITAFSRKPRPIKLVVLGNYGDEPYQRACRQAASSDVIFPGAIFDAAIVQPLRFHAMAYVHGHRVGGTNPSLCEALGAGNAVIAHDNRFNRWVAGDRQFYFTDVDGCEAMIDTVLNGGEALAFARTDARRRHAEAFTWDRILGDYEAMLERLL